MIGVDAGHGPEHPLDVTVVAFQSGVGTRDLFRQYSQHGHEVTLERYLRTPDEMAEQLAARGLSEVVRLVRSGNQIDQYGETMLLHRKTGQVS